MDVSAEKCDPVYEKKKKSSVIGYQQPLFHTKDFFKEFLATNQKEQAILGCHIILKWVTLMVYSNAPCSHFSE